MHKARTIVSKLGIAFRFSLEAVAEKACTHTTQEHPQPSSFFYNLTAVNDKLDGNYKNSYTLSLQLHLLAAGSMDTPSSDAYRSQICDPVGGAVSRGKHI